MNVTISEALERANQICGAGRVTVVRMRPDTGADIETVGRFAHHLDLNGHPTCHDECRSLEEKRCRN